MTTTRREELALQYWENSRAWNGDQRYAHNLTTGALLKRLADLAGTANNTLWQKLEGRAADLLTRVIQAKRCRKSKPIDNIVQLSCRPKILVTNNSTDGATQWVG